MATTTTTTTTTTTVKMTYDGSATGIIDGDNGDEDIDSNH